jgi:RND family efflux transporter MFP subunit
MTSLEIEVDVNEAYIGRVRKGQKVVATLDAYPEWKIAGAVITPVPTADRQKATVRVRISFDELDPRILPDMGIKVSFLGEEREAVADSQPLALVPTAAIRDDGDRRVVFVARGETAERRAVRLGGTRGDHVEVLAGLQAGDRVIVAGGEDLNDGDPISVR